jgi:hypothetical protein
MINSLWVFALASEGKQTTNKQKQRGQKSGQEIDWGERCNRANFHGRLL